MTAERTCRDAGVLTLLTRRAILLLESSLPLKMQEAAMCYRGFTTRLGENELLEKGA